MAVSANCYNYLWEHVNEMTKTIDFWELTNPEPSFFFLLFLRPWPEGFEHRTTRVYAEKPRQNQSTRPLSHQRDTSSGSYMAISRRLWSHLLAQEPSVIITQPGAAATISRETSTSTATTTTKHISTQPHLPYSRQCPHQNRSIGQ